ncbi:TPA: FAD-dependent monooxygenase [Salmonella enterica subsp. enterica serovar Typhi]
MREQLKAWGHRVEFGCELRHFAQTPRTVTAYVAGPTGEEVIIAHYLIGADGGGSFVRKKLGVSFPGRTLGIHALVADASLTRDGKWQPRYGAQEKSFSIAMNRNAAR